MDSNITSMLPDSDIKNDATFKDIYNEAYSSQINSDLQRSKYLNQLDGLSSGSLGNSPVSASIGSKSQLSEDDIVARKQKRVTDRVAELTSDDSNLTILAKQAYNKVNNLWENDSSSGDLKANVGGKQHTMSNKIFENVNDSMAQSEIERDKLINEYNSAEDDPNAKHKVYQLRMQDGFDANGNPLYVYKTGIAENSAAERYKNQAIKGGYEILSEKGFAGAEDWENRWHGNKANLSDRTFDEGYNSDGKNIKKVSGFGAGYSELYNTQHFNQGASQEELDSNKQNSIAISRDAAAKRRAGYGSGSDGVVDAFQAGAVKTGLDLVDTGLDILTPGDNTWLNDAKEQSSIDKWVGYNRKTADKAIGEATGYFKKGDYASAMWEVLKNPQITAESLPANLEMAVGFGKFTAVGKLASELSAAKKINDTKEIARITGVMANDISSSQKVIHEVAKNAGFLAQVAAQTNNHLEERVQNNLEAGMTGGDSLPEAAAVFASNFLSLGLDKAAFGKITGIGAGKKSLADAYGFASPDGKSKLLYGVINQAYKMAENGATEAAQEYVQTWDEILNKQLGTGDTHTLSDVFNKKVNQDEAIGAMLAGGAGGIHIGTGAEIVSGIGGKVVDVATGGPERREAQRLEGIDAIELGNIASGVRSADNTSEPEKRVSASMASALAVSRNGHKAVLRSVLDSIGGKEDINPAELASKFVSAVGTEYADTTGAGANSGSKVLMNRNISSFANNLMHGMNNLKWNNDSLKGSYEAAVANGEIDPEKTDINAYATEKVNQHKLEISKAIGTALDNSGIDISNTVVDKFKQEFVIKPLEEFKKRTRLEESKKSKVAGDLDSLMNGNKEEDLVDPKMSSDEANNIMKQAEILYSIGGSKDTELADLIEQIRSQTGSETVTVNKNSMNVASDVLKNGFHFGKERKKSVVQHNEDITNSIADSLEAINDNSKSKDLEKNLNNVNKNIDEILEFAVSRTQGQEHYISDEDIDRITASGDIKAGIASHIQSLINNTPVGEYEVFSVDSNGNTIKTKNKENPVVNFEKNEKDRLENAPIDKQLQERYGIKSNTRNIVAGATKNGMISSYLYENSLINKELANAIDGLTQLRDRMIQSGKVDGIEAINQKIYTSQKLYDNISFMNEVYKQIHLKSNHISRNRDGSMKYEDQYIKQVIEPGQEFIDDNGVKRIATLEDIANTLRNDIREIKGYSKQKGQKKEVKTKAKTETKTEVKTETESKPAEPEIIDTPGEFDYLDEIDTEFDLNSEEHNEIIEAAEEIETIEDNSVFIHSDENANASARALDKLYNHVIKSDFVKRFLQLDRRKVNSDKTAFEPYGKDSEFGGVLHYAVNQFNAINYAHEMFHAMSYKNLEKKLTKSDREFVESAKSFFKGLDLTDRKTFDATLDKNDRKSNRLYEDMKQLKNSINGENNLFEKELAAIIYSNADARKFIVNSLDSSDKNVNRRKSIADYIKAVFKAYKEIADMIASAFNGDTEKGINTKSDVYRAMVKFVGNSLKQEVARTNTYDSMKDKYDSIAKRFDVDVKNVDLVSTDESLEDRSFSGMLRSRDDGGKKLDITYEDKGKVRKINAKGLETLMGRYINQTLTASEMKKLDSAIKAYDDILDSGSLDELMKMREENKKKSEAKGEANSEAEGKGKSEDNKPTEPEVDVVKEISDNIKSIEVVNTGNKVVNKALKALENNKEDITPEAIKDLNDIISVLKEINNCKG